MNVGKRKITFEGKKSKKTHHGLTVEGVQERVKRLDYMLRKLEPSWSEEEPPWVHEYTLARDDLEKLLDFEVKLFDLLVEKNDERESLIKRFYTQVETLEKFILQSCEDSANSHIQSQRAKDSVCSLKTRILKAFPKEPKQDSLLNSWLENAIDDDDNGLSGLEEYLGASNQVGNVKKHKKKWEK